ncbi:metallopeptidase [archaeon]|nr:metallopeptidase [archaeon]
MARQLDFRHVQLDRVCCIKSQGSKTRRTIARIHALGKVMQLGMNTKAFYVIEFISEKFDRQSEEEKTKTIIHELLHIPASFGGGFRQHHLVNSAAVERHYARLMQQNRLQAENRI